MNNRTAGNGGGLEATPYDVNLSHTIVGANTGDVGDEDLSGTSSFFLDHSLIGTSPSPTFFDTGFSLINVDPELEDLGPNGGPTLTHRPSNTSRVINAGDPAYSGGPFDQRGTARQDGVVDIGAVEMHFGTIEFVDASSTVAEADGSVDLVVRRTGGTDGDVAVAAQSTGGTAFDPDDFAPVGQSVSWVHGDSTDQLVTVTVNPDADHESDEDLTIDLINPYLAAIGANSAHEITITNSNTEPTVSAIGNQTLAADTSSAPLAITVGDSEQAAVDLIVTAESSDQSVVANSGLSFSGTGASRTLVVQPVSGGSGTTTISVTVFDGVLSRVMQFTISVAAPIIPPTPTPSTTTPETTTTSVTTTTTGTPGSGVDGRPAPPVTSPPGGALPVTGGDPRTLGWWSAGLLGIGGVMLRTGRRRRMSRN